MELNVSDRASLIATADLDAFKAEGVELAPHHAGMLVDIEKVELIRQNKSMVDRLEKNRTELEELNEQLMDLATRDALTGLYNRRYFLEAIDLIESGAIEVDSLITHRLPLRDIGEGFRLVMAGTESMKVIIHPND